MLTDRQKQILDDIVNEYIESAQPVSSNSLEKVYDLDISPATIRIEMQKLTDGGYVFQPHTSAGRIPTDKGYRFFVDELQDLYNEENIGIKDGLEIDDLDTFEDTFSFFQEITKKIADNSSSLTLSYISDRGILTKDGLEKMLMEPEFSETEGIVNFFEMLGQFEKNLGSFSEEFTETPEIFIGKESPFPKAGNFTTIVSKFRMPNKKTGIVAILGPKRMPYRKNIGLINSLLKLMSEI
ncbi:MAG: hypothetical protein Q7T34_02145 [Candidatus Parcubacteria bacterium]|nr:hypothetical protein [Candidatus Parcubacteria bacterium]